VRTFFGATTRQRPSYLIKTPAEQKEEEEEEATAEHHPATTTSDEQRGGGKNETRFEGLCRILRASRVECHLQRIEVLCNPLAALHHCSKRSPFK
jgi:hypothetical protein